MGKGKMNKKIVIGSLLAVCMLMIGSVLSSANVNENKLGLQDKEMCFFDINEDSISVTIPVGTYEIRNIEQRHEIFVEDFGSLLIPGKPNLPSKIFSIAVPPEAEVVGISFDASEGVVLPDVYEICPSPLPRVIGEEDPQIYEQDKKIYEENYNLVYDSNDPYPENIVEFERTAGYRKYNLVDVRVTPFTYRPLSGQLIYHPEITVHVSYTFPKGYSIGDIMVDNLAWAEDIAEDIILNYEEAKNWYPSSTTGRGLYDFVIITLDSLTLSVTTLANWETTKGRTVNVVTTSWIDSTYSGYDLAEKMRNFLRDKYPSTEWGIEDVLLVGHYDDVPMRRCAQDAGYGQPETDYYYAELSLPDDQSWDADGDHQWAER